MLDIYLGIRQLTRSQYMYMCVCVNVNLYKLHVSCDLLREYVWLRDISCHLLSICFCRWTVGKQKLSDCSSLPSP